MHKYNGHGATDVTGFGLLGHANNLAKIQKNEVGFVIHNLPVIAKMAAVSKACGNMFGLMQGSSAETSGGYFSCLAQDWGNSSALALKLQQPCMKPSISWKGFSSLFWWLNFAAVLQ